MKQYCPKCQKWYNTETHFCPNCNVVLYTDNDFNNTISKNKKFKIITRKKVEKSYTAGIVMLAIGIFTFIIFGVFCSGLKRMDYVSQLISSILLLSSFLLVIWGAVKMNRYKVITHVPENINSRPIIQCPYCKSFNTVKIQSTNRIASIALMGLASGKVGKQWHCNNCNSDF